MRWRTDYVDGVLLQADDLATEKRYYEERVGILTQAIGFGVVDGLEVRLSDSDKQALKIHPGRAFDAFGRELIVAEERSHNLKEIEEDDWNSDHTETFLCLKFKVVNPVSVPSLLPEKDVSGGAGEEDSKNRRDPGREGSVRVSYQEGFELCFAPRDKLPWLGWRFPGTALSEPINPDPRFVPIARLICDKDNPEQLDIDTSGRPLVIVPGTTRLTRIVSINWPHEGSFHLNVPLEFRFSAALSSDPPAAAATATVEKSDGTLRRLRWKQGHPCLDEERKRLVAAVDEEQLKSVGPGDLIRVRLACDFVLDEHGLPVSGVHLAGLLPSGNGIAGGTFESWFTLQRGGKMQAKPYKANSRKGEVK